MMPSFNGFKETDFSDQIGGVYWRSRNALGGVLAQALHDSFQVDFQSWAIRRRTELHIARPSRYDFANPFPHAKLFVYTPRHELALGFYIEKWDQPVDHRWDWTRFVANLQENPVMRTSLLAAMRNHALVMTDYYQQGTGGALGCKFLYYRDQFCCQQQGEDPRPVRVEDLVRQLREVGENTWCDVQVFTSIPKEQAIDLKERVVQEILTVLHSLMPVYEGTIRRG